MPPSRQGNASKNRAVTIVRAFAIEPGEGARTALLFALLFVASMIFVMGRTARDALFLTKFPVTWIAYMWVGYGVVSSLVAVGYGWLSSNVTRARLVISFTVSAAATYALVRVLIGADIGWAYAFFYIWAEVIANLVIVQAWTITNDLHDARSAKRLFGVIGAGRVVGMLLTGFITGALVRAIGTANLILVVVGLMLVFVGLVCVISARYALPTVQVRSVADNAVAADGRNSPQHTRYALFISAMLLTMFVVLTVGDYQFKAIAKISYPDRDDLAAYMAGFYAAMGAIACVFQVFLTPRILRHLGVLAGLLTMPLAFLSSTTVLFFAPVLASATALKLSDNGLQYTIHDATMQLLYFAFPASTRGRVRAVLDAMVKPLGYSLGGVALVFLSPVPLPGETPAQLAVRTGHLGVVSLVLGLAWLVLAPVVRKAYVEALRQSLVRRQSDVSDEGDVVYDPVVRRVLTDALHSGEAPQVIYAVERLAASHPESLRAELLTLTEHKSAAVRALALRQSALLKDPEASNRARLALQDPEPRVCSAALDALGIACGDEAVDQIAPFVADDSRPDLRDAAVASLISHAGLDGMLVGGAKLQHLLQSPSENDRASAAAILGAVGQASLARNLLGLLKDPSRRVRRAAAAAASRCASPSLVGPLIESLTVRALIKPATHALAAIGPPAVPELAAQLARPETTRMVRLHIPRALQLIGTRDALDALFACLGDPDEGVRQKVLANASRLRETLHVPPLEPERLRPLIQAEVDDHVALREGYLQARAWLARPLLDAQIRLELRGNIMRIMRMCELAYSRAHVAAAREAMFSHEPSRRANALEVLDNVLDRNVRESILDAVARFASVMAFRDVAHAPGSDMPSQVVEWVEQRVALPGYYRRAVLFEAIGVHGATRVAPLASRFADSDNPFLRENALLAVGACRVDGWQQLIATHAEKDECPVVRAYARYVLAHDSAGLDPEDDMYTTIEKILFLEGLPLFADVSGNDLMPLARVATIVRLSKASAVFRAGDPGDSLYVVVHGKVAIVHQGQEVALLGPGEVFGEMAILDREPRGMDAIVRDDADLLRVSAEDFSNAIEDTGEIATGVIRVLSRRLREANRRDPVAAADEAKRKASA